MGSRGPGEGEGPGRSLRGRLVAPGWEHRARCCSEHEAGSNFGPHVHFTAGETAQGSLRLRPLCSHARARLMTAA